MKATSISAKTMRSEECGANLSDVYHEAMLCLNPKKKTRKDVESKIKQASDLLKSFNPVVIIFYFVIVNPLSFVGIY